MTDYLQIAGLQVDPTLHRFIADEALPGSGVEEAAFWDGFAGLVRDQVPRNRALLARRVELQDQIDAWHEGHGSAVVDAARVRLVSADDRLPGTGGRGLRDRDGRGRRRDRGGAGTTARRPGVQCAICPERGERSLGLPLRRALRHGCARRGPRFRSLRPGPGAEGDRLGRAFLDAVVPLAAGSHADAVAYMVVDGELEVALPGDQRTGLAEPGQFVGHRGDPSSPSAIVLCHHGLHMQLVIDRTAAVGADDPAGISDVVIEAAMTTIMDCEDSVAAVDVADKVLVYRNWLGLMQGTLEQEVVKAGGAFTRRLNPDLEFVDRAGNALRLRGRALMLVRNVGHLMTTDAVLDEHGEEVPEGLLDAMVTVLAAKHDLLRDPEVRNSPLGSIYVVKPKMHGPAEVAFSADVFAQVEQALGLPVDTVKIGLMDEERRTSVNLQECIRAARSRVAFINTGFLDRTGDEIHTSMHGGSDAAQGRHESRAVAHRLRAAQRLRSGWRCGLPRSSPDRQGHVGRARPHGDDAGGEDRSPAGRSELRMGAVADRGVAARDPLPPGRRVRTAGPAGQGTDRPDSKTS